jgi:hypothetical protein
MIHSIAQSTRRSWRLGRPWPGSYVSHNSPYNALPLGVGEKSGLVVGLNGYRRCASLAGLSQFGLTPSRSIMVGGVSCSVSCLVRALCHRAW